MRAWVSKVGERLQAMHLNGSLMLAVLLVVGVVVFNEAGYMRSSDSTQAWKRAADMRQALYHLQQLVLEAETSQRAYLLTGRRAYLEPYEKAVPQIGRAFDVVRNAVWGNSEQIEELSKLSRAVQRKLTEMDLSVRLKEQDKELAWRAILEFDVGRNQMEVIRKSAQTMVDYSTKRLEQSDQEIQQSLMISRIAISMAALLCLVAVMFYLRQTRTLSMLQAQNRQALQKANEDLDRQVTERTQELTELTHHLQKVQEREREHLARELHDELGALLTAAKMDMARLKMKLESAPDDVHERMHKINQMLNAVVALKRRIIEDLRPSALSNLGLVTALEILFKVFLDRTQVPIDCSIEPIDADADVELTVYRLVQESLNNAAKYAQAKQVQVKLARYPSHIEVMVRDDGCGFNSEQVQRTSHGLVGMRHRIQAHQGVLRVVSAPGQGTTIEAVIPMNPRAKQP